MQKMIALSTIVVLSVVLASILASAAPAPSTERSVDKFDLSDAVIRRFIDSPSSLLELAEANKNVGVPADDGCPVALSIGFFGQYFCPYVEVQTKSRVAANSKLTS